MFVIVYVLCLVYVLVFVCFVVDFLFATLMFFGGCFGMIYLCVLCCFVECVCFSFVLVYYNYLAWSRILFVVAFLFFSIAFCFYSCFDVLCL